MSGGTACSCAESKKPIAERAWEVTQRFCNHSAFNGNRLTFSHYSAIRCDACRACWRTKARYVGHLKDAKRS